MWALPLPLPWQNFAAAPCAEASASSVTARKLAVTSIISQTHMNIDLDFLLQFTATPLLAVLVACLLLLFLLLWRWRWRDYSLPARLARDLSPVGDGATASVAAETSLADDVIPALRRPLVSVVIAACNAAEALERYLPQMLAQDMEDYEVIVVDEASTDDTREVVKRLQRDDNRLRFTFVPTSAYSTDRRKLAIALGIRAARAPWVVLTEADCSAVSPAWLRHLAQHFDDATDFVIGYANYDAADSRHSHLRFERLRHQLRCFRSARGRAIGGDVDNLALRRDYFLEHGGYVDSLGTGCGEGDLLIDALAADGRTAVEVRCEGSVRQALPDAFTLGSVRRQQHRALHELSPRGRSFLHRDASATTAAWCFAALAAIYIALRAFRVVVTACYAPVDIALDAAVVFLLLSVIVVPYLLLRRSTDILGEQRFGAFRLFGYQFV